VEFLPNACAPRKHGEADGPRLKWARRLSRRRFQQFRWRSRTDGPRLKWARRLSRRRSQGIRWRSRTDGPLETSEAAKLFDEGARRCIGQRTKIGDEVRLVVVAGHCRNFRPPHRRERLRDTERLMETEQPRVGFRARSKGFEEAATEMPLTDPERRGDGGDAGRGRRFAASSASADAEEASIPGFLRPSIAPSKAAARASSSVASASCSQSRFASVAPQRSSNGTIFPLNSPAVTPKTASDAPRRRRNVWLRCPRRRSFRRAAVATPFTCTSTLPAPEKRATISMSGCGSATRRPSASQR